MIRKWFVVLLWTVLSASLNGAYASSYFPAESMDPALLTPPLAPQSEAWNAEIKYMIDVQNNADDKSVKQASDERSMSPEMVVLAVDPALTRASHPALYRLLDNVGDTTLPVVINAKQFWHTVRPYASDPQVKALAGTVDNSPSYPSGHCAGSYVWASVMGEVLPEKRQAFMQRANEIAQHRVLIGVHYPHDLAGGKELSLLVLGALMQNPAFQKDLASAKEELTKSSASTPAKL